jgi:Sulfotransferase domain
MPGRPIVASRFTPSVRRFRARRRSGLAPGARIFGIGLSRTGTMSLAHALGMLGYRSLHYPDDDRTREEIGSFLASGGDRLRLTVLESCDAITDTPICATFEALDAAYPGSRFILTIREKESWLDSCQGFWGIWFDPGLRGQPPEHPDAYIQAISEKLYRGPKFDRGRFSRAYDDYHERVRRHFRDRPTDLLELDICAGDGWDPLCDFLNVRVPRMEFPWGNRMPQARSA